MPKLVAVTLLSAAGSAAAFSVAPSLSGPRIAPSALSRSGLQGVSTLNRPATAARFLTNVRGTAAMPGDAMVSGDSETGGKLAPWRQNFDLEAWGKEIRAIEKETREDMGQKDLDHLQKMRNYTLAIYALGLATAGWAKLPWNPISAILLSVSICVRWTMIGHHTCHGGYNGVVGGEHRFHRSKFAKGPVRRFIDWCDWMLPEAWDVEHNFKHHYELGESSDPDLLERNAHTIRENKIVPTAFKYFEMFMLMIMWKWFYYAPNTVKEMYERQEMLAKQKGKTFKRQPFEMPQAPGDYGMATKAATMKSVFAPMLKGNFYPFKVMFGVLAPYFTAHFVITPLIFYALFGKVVAMCALTNLFAAEILTNIHSFIIVVPNHAGEDVYRFKTPVKIKSDEFYLRAVIGSVNFRTGSNFNDYFHGWLNYQIEHHMWPDMSMLAYQRCAPKVKAVCEKYGVPYVQENVFVRLWKTLQIGVGTKSMKVWENGD
mmetsp:Transcript_17799/g.44966  ORF Transcript_17799/g.44966 Transcript_17799/m.44966 type:complete len:486 (+) Transcript_17799:177-1634(+)